MSQLAEFSLVLGKTKFNFRLNDPRRDLRFIVGTKAAFISSCLLLHIFYAFLLATRLSHRHFKTMPPQVSWLQICSVLSSGLGSWLSAPRSGGEREVIMNCLRSHRVCFRGIQYPARWRREHFNCFCAWMELLRVFRPHKHHQAELGGCPLVSQSRYRQASALVVQLILFITTVPLRKLVRGPLGPTGGL